MRKTHKRERKNRRRTCSRHTILLSIISPCRKAALVFHSDLRLVVDLQSNLKAQQSAAYARKVTLSNLREAAKTLCYIQEHGYDNREELEAAFEASNHELTASRTALRESDDRIKELNEQIHYIGQYFANKAVHGDFLNAKDKKSYREKHSAELDLYNAARMFLKKAFPIKCRPSAS